MLLRNLINTISDYDTVIIMSFFEKSMLAIALVFNSGLDFTFFVNNNKNCFGPFLYFKLKKSGATDIATFLFKGFFGVFYAKIWIFMAKVLVLSIKFL